MLTRTSKSAAGSASAEKIEKIRSRTGFASTTLCTHWHRRSRERAAQCTLPGPTRPGRHSPREQRNREGAVMVSRVCYEPHHAVVRLQTLQRFNSRT